MFCKVFQYPSEEVICEPVPQSVRNLLQDLQVDMKRVIFLRSLDYEISNAHPGEFSNVATLYAKAKAKYQKIREKYEQGEDHYL